MKTTTITAKEFAGLYDCSHSFVTRKLRDDQGILPMLSWKKSGGTWLVEVPLEWVEK